MSGWIQAAMQQNTISIRKTDCVSGMSEMEGKGMYARLYLILYPICQSDWLESIH